MTLYKNVGIDEDLHARLKAYAALKKRTMTEALEEIIKEAIGEVDMNENI